MSEGAEYPKWITCKDGLKVEVKSEADEALWRDAPAPPERVTASGVPNPFGASPMVDTQPAKPAKKGKGATDA